MRRESYEDEVGFGSTEYIVFRNIEGITDNKFVYYFVMSPPGAAIVVPGP